MIAARGLWGKTNLYYQLLRNNINIDRIVNNSLRESMQNIRGIVNFRERVAEQNRKDNKIAMEIGSMFIPMGWLTKLRYVKYAARLIKLRKGAKALKALTSVERAIVKEANSILNSPQMETLRFAFKEGVEAEVQIGGRTVIYNPSLRASAMTLHCENAFLMGREAFSSSAETGKTVLQELYRLDTQGTGELGKNLTRQYTDDALISQRRQLIFLHL